MEHARARLHCRVFVNVQKVMYLDKLSAGFRSRSYIFEVPEQPFSEGQGGSNEVELLSEKKRVSRVSQVNKIVVMLSGQSYMAGVDKSLRHCSHH